MAAIRSQIDWVLCLQARILTISPEMEDYARRVAQEMKKAGIRAEVMTGIRKYSIRIEQCRTRL